MGGVGSGQWLRYHSKETTDGVLTLSLHTLLRDRLLRPDIHTVGTLTWRRLSTGEQAATCGYEVNTIDVDNAWLRLRYILTRPSGAKDTLDYRIALTTTRPHFGGILWFFCCPVSQRRCSKLYLPAGARYFACRQVYDLVYASQRENPAHRAMRRAQNIRMRLGGTGNMSLPFPPKPGGMHWHTYARLHDREQQAVGEMCEGLAVWLDKLKRRTHWC